MRVFRNSFAAPRGCSKIVSAPRQSIEVVGGRDGAAGVLVRAAPHPPMPRERGASGDHRSTVRATLVAGICLLSAAHFNAATTCSAVVPGGAPFKISRARSIARSILENSFGSCISFHRYRAQVDEPPPRQGTQARWIKPHRSRGMETARRGRLGYFQG